jgi:hypothetical protein
MHLCVCVLLRCVVYCFVLLCLVCLQATSCDFTVLPNRISAQGSCEVVVGELHRSGFRWRYTIGHSVHCHWTKSVKSTQLSTVQHGSHAMLLMRCISRYTLHTTVRSTQSNAQDKPILGTRLTYSVHDARHYDTDPKQTTQSHSTLHSTHHND